MSLDVPTLMFAGALVSLSSGVILAFAWHQHRGMRSVLWWAASNVVLALGISLLVAGATNHEGALVSSAVTCFTLASALLWHAARLFSGLRPRYAVLVAGPLFIGVMSGLAGPSPADGIYPAIAPLLNAIYLTVAAVTLAFQSRERLISRWPLAVFVLVHAVILLAGAVTFVLSPDAPTLPSVVSAFGIINFEAIVFTIGTTIFIVAAMRESSELSHKVAATIDALTGVSSRGEFLSRAERLLERARREARALAVIVIDLDRFKAINDGFRHAMGDRVLVIFAEVARKALRPNDLLGRLGGEEFGAVLPGSDLQAAIAMADRIRRTFAGAAAVVDGKSLNATFSAGVAGSADLGGRTLSEMMQSADSALTAPSGAAATESKVMRKTTVAKRFLSGSPRGLDAVRILFYWRI